MKAQEKTAVFRTPDSCNYLISWIQDCQLTVSVNPRNLSAAFEVTPIQNCRIVIITVQIHMLTV